MAQPFKIQGEMEVPAPPEEAWEAIATGPGIDSWFMGVNEVEPREGGTIRTELPGETSETRITNWDPPSHLVHRSDPAEDGTQHVFEYVVEPRGGGSSIRWTHSGFLGGDWEAEYEALQEGDPAYFAKLATYLTHFRGRTATPVEAFGPEGSDLDKAWATLRAGLRLDHPPELGERVRLTPERLAPIDGVVDYLAPHFLGVRGDDGIYRFILAFPGPVMVGHHVFADIDREAEERAWTEWMNTVFD